MTDRDTNDESDPSKTDISVRLTESVPEDINVTWQELGYNSRNEFTHDVLRDAVKHPNFTQESWEETATSEHERRIGESEEVLSSTDDSEAR